MRRSINLSAVPFLVVILSGCIGGIAVRPIECESNYPLKYYIYSKDSWGPYLVNQSTQGKSPSNNPLTKDDFLEDFGQPDEKVVISENKEMWVYNRSSFCGVVPVYIIPVPLGLPVCDTFDHITFENDKAVHIHFRKTSAAGFLATGFGGTASGFDKCPADYVSTISPEVISVPGTESCRQVAFNDSSIMWTDGHDIIKSDQSSKEVIDRISVAGNNEYDFDLSASGFGSVWVRKNDYKQNIVSRIDLETGEIVANILMDHRPGSIRIGEDSVWVGSDDNKSNSLSRIDPETNQIIARIQLEENKDPNYRQGPFAIGEGSVWILHSKYLGFFKGSQPLLTRIDSQTNKLIATIPILSGSSGYDRKIVVGGGSVWIVQSNHLYQFNPQTNLLENAFREVLSVNHVIDMSANEDTLWILGYDYKDKIIRLLGYDTKTNTLRFTTDLGSTEMGGSSDELALRKVRLAVSDEAVWTCLPMGIHVIPTHFLD